MLDLVPGVSHRTQICLASARLLAFTLEAVYLSAQFFEEICPVTHEITWQCQPISPTQ